MKLSHWFLILLIAFGLVIINILVSEAPPASTGKAHAEYSTMLHSGSNVTDSNEVKWSSYLFGLGIIGIFVFGLAFGAQKPNGLKGINKWLIIGAIAYLCVFSYLVFSYWLYADSESTTYVMGVPKPTAIMLFGLGGIPLIFSIIYVTQFKRWVLSDDDEARFNQIVAARRKKEI